MTADRIDHTGAFDIDAASLSRFLGCDEPIVEASEHGRTARPCGVCDRCVRREDSR